MVRSFRGKLYSYLKALAVADLCFLAFAVSSIIHVLDNGKEKEQGGLTNYIQMYYQAHFENALVNGFLASSVFIIVVMTIDR
jgi:putative exporter of polyketide antibiotics